MKFRHLTFAATVAGICVAGIVTDCLSAQLGFSGYADEGPPTGVSVQFSDHAQVPSQPTLSQNSIMLQPGPAYVALPDAEAYVSPIVTGNSYANETINPWPVSQQGFDQPSMGATQCNDPQCSNPQCGDPSCGRQIGSRLTGFNFKAKKAARELSKYGEPKITVKEMWDRERPTGDQSLHFPYQTQRMYYYRRPYNSVTIRQAQLNRDPAAGTNVNSAYPYQGQPYRTSVFENVNRSHAFQHSGSIDSRSLEFVDWRKHQQAKANWDSQYGDSNGSENSPPEPRLVPDYSDPLSPPEAVEDDSLFLSRSLGVNRDSLKPLSGRGN